jgi:hypothetical protein
VWQVSAQGTRLVFIEAGQQNDEDEFEDDDD